jgi:hypothetical protein
MSTPCTICGLPCPGSDTDDEACCLACFTANLAGAELRPPASVTGRWRRRLEGGELALPGYLREAVAEGDDEGRG